MTLSAQAGVFITFEGGEGAGKTTHIKFLADALRSQGAEVLCVREPGGTVAGEALRGIVLDTGSEGLSDEAELLIFEAARSQLVKEVIAPALKRGAVVLCDRFCDSTLAYQGYGRGLSLEFIRLANEFACRGVCPHRTVLMRVSDCAQVGLKRATRHSADRMECQGDSFHTRVNRGFDEIAERFPQRVRVVDSSQPKPITARCVFGAVADLFGWDPSALPFEEDYFEGVERYHGKRPDGRQAG